MVHEIILTRSMTSKNKSRLLGFNIVPSISNTKTLLLKVPEIYKRMIIHVVILASRLTM